MYIAQNFKPYLRTIIWCGFLLFISFPIHGGFIVFLAYLIILPLSINGLYLIHKKPELKKQISNKIYIWFLTTFIVIIHHIYLHNNARTAADEAVNIIQIYKTAHGTYPQDIDEAGLNTKRFRKHHIFYSTFAKKPLLFYHNTLVPFETIDYDFDKNEWFNNNN